MRRRDFLALFPGAAVARPSPSLAAGPVAAPVGIEINVKRDFGARGDGVTDDWQAIENAGMVLENRGGGRMYFPPGRYRLPTFARNITVRNNVEYCGAGNSSVIIGSNAVFISPHGANFGRGSYGTYTYFAAHDIVAGDQSIQTITAADAAYFSPGDIIVARSTGAMGTATDVLPYYVEMNRVISASAGVITLEDPIDDGWHGVIVAKVTDDVSQGYSIHDLRIECENGYPFFIQASYKGVIRDCWTRGLSVIGANAFTRSVAHNIIATVLWSAGGDMASLFEIETGSVRAAIHDVEVEISGTASPSGQYPLFYFQEFSRRTSIRNIRVAASSVTLGNIVMAATAGGHSFENIHVLTQAVDKVLDYAGCDPAVYSHNHLPTTLKGIVIDTLNPTNGFNHGFILHNNYPGGRVENVTVQDCAINGVTDPGEHNLIWFWQGAQRNILFENVRGAADVKMNTAGLSGANIGLPGGGTPDYPLTDVQIRNCAFRRIVSEALLEQATFTNSRRINSLLPMSRRWPATTAWVNDVAARALMTVTIPTNATVCRGDHVDVQLAAEYPAGAGAARVAVKIFGSIVLAVDLLPAIRQVVDVNLRIALVDGSFVAPTKYVVSGTATVNDRIAPSRGRSGGAFDTRVANVIELLAWAEGSVADGSGFVVKTAKIAYVCVED